MWDCLRQNGREERPAKISLAFPDEDLEILNLDLLTLVTTEPAPTVPPFPIHAPANTITLPLRRLRYALPFHIPVPSTPVEQTGPWGGLHYKGRHLDQEVPVRRW